MQDQWKAERVKWRKREADLEAISEQCRKELDTLKAIVKAKAVSPTYVSPVERTSMSGGRPVFNLDMQAGRPESNVDVDGGGSAAMVPDGGTGGTGGTGGGGGGGGAMPASPTHATLNNRVSWSGIGVLPEGAAVTATAAAATLGADSPSGDGLPPMPGSTPPDRPRKYTATEWV